MRSRAIIDNALSRVDDNLVDDGTIDQVFNAPCQGVQGLCGTSLHTYTQRAKESESLDQDDLSSVDSLDAIRCQSPTSFPLSASTVFMICLSIPKCPPGRSPPAGTLDEPEP